MGIESGVQESGVRSSGVQEFRSQKFRSQEFRSSEVQEFRSQEFRSQEFRSQKFRRIPPSTEGWNNLALMGNGRCSPFSRFCPLYPFPGARKQALNVV